MSELANEMANRIRKAEGRGYQRGFDEGYNFGLETGRNESISVAEGQKVAFFAAIVGVGLGAMLSLVVTTW